MSECHEHFPLAHLHPQLTFPLHNEKDEHGNPIDGNAFWVAITQDDKTVSEGKIFLPRKPGLESHLVIFTPGMSGTRFCSFIEKRLVNPLLKEGISSLVLRHLGTWLQGSRAQEHIACPERGRIGHKLHQDNIGEQKLYSIDQLVQEITTALQTLGPSFDRITLVGHSSGALGEALAIQEISKDIQQKIRHFISLSGLLGGMEHLQWYLRNRFILGLYLWDCQRDIRLASPSVNIRKLQQMFHRLFQEKLPPHIMSILIHAPEDELICPAASAHYQNHNDRGLSIIDKTQKFFYHELPNIQPETLIRLLQSYHPDSKHTVTFEGKKNKK